jgi:hypothetical protein
MNNGGHLMLLEDFLTLAEDSRISREDFMRLTEGTCSQGSARRNGNGKNHRRGVWEPVMDAEYGTELKENTIIATFDDGPVCLMNLARNGVRDLQHNFLFNCTTFLKRKYSDNWEKALEWVNDNVLAPTGDRQKLKELIRTTKNHDYEYQCNDEPLCSHCYVKACRQTRYGVGQSGNFEGDFWLKIYDCKPQKYEAHMGDTVAVIDTDTLLNNKSFRKMCLENGYPFPDSMPVKKWDTVVRAKLAEAEIVEPPELLKTNYGNIGILERWLDRRVPNVVGRKGDEYLNGKVGCATNVTRMRLKERRIYFKWKHLSEYLSKAYGWNSGQMMQYEMFISQNALYHNKLCSLGQWYRCTHSVSFDLFNELTIERWLAGGEVEEE